MLLSIKIHQISCSRYRTSKATQGREEGFNLSIREVPKGILRDRQSQNSHEDSHWGETIRLQPMQSAIYYKGAFAGS